MVACSAQSSKVSCVLLPSLCVLAQEMDKSQPICRLCLQICLQIEAHALNKALLPATGIGNCLQETRILYVLPVTSTFLLLQSYIIAFPLICYVIYAAV